jgi:hypothetical protein
MKIKSEKTLSITERRWTIIEVKISFCITLPLVSSVLRMNNALLLAQQGVSWNWLPYLRFLHFLSFSQKILEHFLQSRIRTCHASSPERFPVGGLSVLWARKMSPKTHQYVERITTAASFAYQSRACEQARRHTHTCGLCFPRHFSGK